MNTKTVVLAFLAISLCLFSGCGEGLAVKKIEIRNQFHKKVYLTKIESVALPKPLMGVGAGKTESFQVSGVKAESLTIHWYFQDVQKGLPAKRKTVVTIGSKKKGKGQGVLVLQLSAQKAWTGVVE